MRITGYRSLMTTMDWGHPVGDVNGTFQTSATPCPVLAIDTSDGITGYAASEHPDIASMFDLIEGRSPLAPQSIYDSLIRACFKAGHQGRVHATIGAIDIALWDIASRAAGLPLWRMLGADTRFVRGYASGLDIGLGASEVFEFYRAFGERGFSAAKVKGGADTASDTGRLLAAREALSASSSGTPAVMLDANEAWHPSEAVRYITEIEKRVDLAWVEEPVRRWDVEGHAFVRNKIRSGVATGENLSGIEQFGPLIRGRGADVLQVGSRWGITHLMRVAATSQAFNLLVSPVGATLPLLGALAPVANHPGAEIQSLNVPAGMAVHHWIESGGVLLSDEPGLGVVFHEGEFCAPAVAKRADAGPNLPATWAGLRLSSVHTDQLKDGELEHSSRAAGREW